MTLEQRQKRFSEGIDALAKELGIRSLVADVEFVEGETTATWWPGCKDECLSPEVCASKVFIKASLNLQEHSVATLDEAVAHWEESDEDVEGEPNE